MYDYLVVGSGLYGAVFAHEAKSHGKSVLVIDKRPNIAGNIYTENIEGINVHKYGAHIFHTNNKKVWSYITKYAEFNRFTNSPVANYKGELYSLPFNMYTFNKMWGVVTPEEAAAKIEEQRKEITGEPKNLEEQAISLVGRDIYEKLIKGYTEKQWGRDCKDLPSFIIKRLPVRLTFDNNYFNALYQGIPVGGYTKLIANLLEGVEVRLNTDYLEHKTELAALAGSNIIKTVDGAEADGRKLDPESYVSMNFWGFPAKEECAPAYLGVLEQGFKEFFENDVKANPLKAEYLLPTHIGGLLRDGKYTVKVLETTDKWFGVTYKEDKESVVQSFKKLIADGVYREELYSDL